MSDTATELSHRELSLLLFALQGGEDAAMPDASSCEEACPVVESVEELLCRGTLDPKQQLVRHLNNHLREGLIECGMFELMASAEPRGEQTFTIEHQAKLQQINAQLSAWSCQIKLDDAERRILYESLSSLPWSSWITMPRTLWKLKSELRTK